MNGCACGSPHLEFAKALGLTVPPSVLIRVDIC